MPQACKRNLIGCGLILLSLSALHASAAPAASIAQIIAQAQADQKAGRFAEALALLTIPPGATPLETKALRLTIANVQYAWAQSLLTNSPALALPHFQAALVIDRPLRLEGTADDLTNMGVAYYSLGQYPKAVTLEQQALPLYQQTADKEGEAKALVDLGDISTASGQPLKAIGFQQQALLLFRQIKSQGGEASALVNLGNAYEGLEKHEEAERFYQQALLLVRQTRDRDDTAKLLNDMGIVCNEQSRYSAAIGFFQQALSQQSGDTGTKASILANLGNAYAGLHQYSKAIAFFQQAIPLFRQRGNDTKAAQVLANLKTASQRLSTH